MRDLNDLKVFQVTLIGTVELDLERVAEDPIWSLVSNGFDLTDKEQQNQALEKYLCQYLMREVLLRDMPSTNGPLTPAGYTITPLTE